MTKSRIGGIALAIIFLAVGLITKFKAWRNR